MTGYLVNFAVYTMAMLGLIFFALMIYKKFSIGGISRTSKSRMLSIEETISIAPRKTLYVVKAGDEKFLIAGDVDKTTLISKLGCNTSSDNIQGLDYSKPQAVEEHYAINNTSEISKKSIYNNGIEEFPVVVDFQDKLKKQPNVLHDMLRKING